MPGTAQIPRADRSWPEIASRARAESRAHAGPCRARPACPPRAARVPNGLACLTGRAVLARHKRAGPGLALRPDFDDKPCSVRAAGLSRPVTVRAVPGQHSEDIGAAHLSRPRWTAIPTHYTWISSAQQEDGFLNTGIGLFYHFIKSQNTNYQTMQTPHNQAEEHLTLTAES